MLSIASPHTRACADKAIQKALGKPWECLAKGPSSFDCWGFVWYVYASMQIDAPSFGYSKGDPREDLFRKGIAKALAGGWKRVPDRTPYSVILFGSKGAISHVAIYHPSGKAYHSIERYGVVGHQLSFFTPLFDTIEYWGPPCTT